MAWDMFPVGTQVTVDPENQKGRDLSQTLQSMGLNPFETIMTVHKNNMVPANDGYNDWLWSNHKRHIPHLIVTLPNGKEIETEPIAVARAS